MTERSWRSRSATASAHAAHSLRVEPNKPSVVDYAVSLRVDREARRKHAAAGIVRRNCRGAREEARSLTLAVVVDAFLNVDVPLERHDVISLRKLGQHFLGVRHAMPKL